nr:immunoglobulin light chain junction region [Macaca mulatta]
CQQHGSWPQLTV